MKKLKGNKKEKFKNNVLALAKKAAPEKAAPGLFLIYWMALENQIPRTNLFTTNVVAATPVDAQAEWEKWNAANPDQNTNILRRMVHLVFLGQPVGG